MSDARPVQTFGAKVLDRRRRLLLHYATHPMTIAKVLAFRWRSAPSKEAHIFVVGAPRSGTTLIEKVVAAHSQICSLEVETGLFTYRNLFEESVPVPELSFEEFCKRHGRPRHVVDYFDRIAALVKARTGRPLFLEKTPQHVLHLQFLAKNFPESRIINVYRDGRDCYSSAKKARNIPQAKNVEDFARYWARCVRTRMQAGPDARLVDIRYEDFVENPERHLSALMTSLGMELECENAQLDVAARRMDQRSKTAAFGKLGHPIDQSSVGRWKCDLSSSEVAEFERIASPELKALDYTEQSQAAI